MVIRFVCPFGHPIKAADHRIGKKGRCPICQQKVIVPVANPQPRGSEKRSWDAPGTNSIEIDDGQAPPSMPPTPSGPAVPSGRKRKRRSISRRSISASALSLPPPAAPVAAVVAPCLTIDDSAAQVPLPPSPPPVVVPPPVAERIEVPPKPILGKRGLAPETPPRWVGRMKSELDPYVYRAGAQQVETVYWLAAILLFSVVFGAAPALRHWHLADAPAWAQIMLLVAAAQLAYTAWLVVLPDWSTVWVGMIVFAVMGAGYGTAMALIGSMPQGKPPPLGLAGAGSSAAGWCGANVVVMGLASFACGRLATKWRRANGAPRTW